MYGDMKEKFLFSYWRLKTLEQLWMVSEVTFLLRSEIVKKIPKNHMKKKALNSFVLHLLHLNVVSQSSVPRGVGGRTQV